ncbi:YibE/F family protein [Candidatus Dojkabacteria bacterium]|nr:YibE/F family protein [Candidatus Dojkabacteria bacterium]
MSALKGKIKTIDESEQYDEYEVELLNGDQKGEKITIQIPKGQNVVTWGVEYSIGDDVYIQEAQIGEDKMYSFEGRVRTFPIIILALLFAGLSIAIGKKKGLGSLVGLIFSIAILFGVTVPAMVAGYSPLIVGAASIILILIPTMYMSHGFNPKTTIALIGTVVSIIISLVIGQIFVYLCKLSGVATEDSRVLAMQLSENINFRGILLLSLIIGAVGVIDDVTVSQVSTIVEIFKANPKVDLKRLLDSSMTVGRDHIASMINSLVMAYVGASLPFIMLLYAVKMDFWQVLSLEFITEEVVRTLTGSIALIIAVPITSFIACYAVTRPGSVKKWVNM